MATLVKGQPTNEEEVREEALRILDRMREIADADMLMRGTYVTEDVVDPQRVGQVCRGHKACAIGSLWLAADVPFRKLGDGWGMTLPGLDEDTRGSFVRRRPPLKLALEALNAAASDYLVKHRMYGAAYKDAVERLFETIEIKTSSKRRKVMLEVIATAADIVADPRP